MQTIKPLVSVIMPAYNHENYVQEAIQSVINSSYENIELLVIDDGSKDSTWQKINAMQADCKRRFTNIIFETKPNGGTCETLNLLIEKSSGEYIFLIASDDMVKPQTIEKEVNFLNNNPNYALVVGDNELIDGENTQIYWDKHQKTVYNKDKAKHESFAHFLRYRRKDVDFLSDDFGSYSALVIGNHIPNGYLIRKSIFDIIGYFTKDAPLEDYWLMLQISKYAKIKYIDEIFFSYRWHDANTISHSTKISTYIKQTLIHEMKLLNKLDVSKCLPQVAQIQEKPRVHISLNILGLIQFTRARTIEYKIKTLKILGIPVYTKQKTRL